MDPRFAATLCLFANNPSDFIREKVITKWTGNPMLVRDLRLASREIGEQDHYTVGAPVRGAIPQRFAFLTRFFHAAGYNGWVILLDETEMISKYSVRQRGRAYSHLAQLLGLVKGVTMPGLASVCTITRDYTGQVLYGRKSDLEMVPAKLHGTKDDEHAESAVIGMNAIKSRGLNCIPTQQQVEDIYQRIRHGSMPTPTRVNPAGDGLRREYAASTGMRQYLRAWINVWDLRRLYDVQAEIVTDTVTQSYDEDHDLQASDDADDAPRIVL